MEQKKYDIFVNYSRKDSEVVIPIVKSLEEEGYQVWIDINGIESSEQFKKKIVDVIENSTVFLFFSSVNSNASDWTAKEIGIAVDAKKPIIPIKLDDAQYNKSVKFDLINLDFADYASGKQKAIEKMHKAIVTYCGVPIPKKEELELKKKREKLQAKYDFLRDQLVDLCKKRNNIINDMQNLGMEVSVQKEFDINTDLTKEIERLKKENANLEKQCSTLKQEIRSIKAGESFTDKDINCEPDIPSNPGTQAKQAMWQDAASFKRNTKLTYSFSQDLKYTLSMIILLPIFVYLAVAGIALMITEDKIDHKAAGALLIAIAIWGIFYLKRRMESYTIASVEVVPNGTDLFRIRNKKGNYGIAIKSGAREAKIILKPAYSSITKCKGGYYLIKNGRYGLFNDEQKQIIIPCEYDALTFVGNGDVKALKGKTECRFTSDGLKYEAEF